jgi:nucleotide-binding universal stress UspA family protein
MPLSRERTTTTTAGPAPAGPDRRVTRWPRRSVRPLVRQDAARVTGPHPGPDGAVVLVDRPEPRRSGPPRVVAAVRDLPDDLAVLDEAADVARGIGAEVVVAHAVPISFGEHSVGLAEALRHGQEVLEVARRRVADQVPELMVSTTLTRRWAHELLGEDLDADLVVLGGWRADRRAGLGLAAHSAVHHAPCPVLLVPRG